MKNKNDKIIIDDIQAVIDVLDVFQNHIHSYYSGNPDKIDRDLLGDTVTTANYLQDLLEQLKNGIEAGSNGKARKNVQGKIGS